MPFKGKSPSIAPILIIDWTPSQVMMPAIIRRASQDCVLEAMVNIRIRSAPITTIIIVEPINPNFSEYIAKIESVGVSGR